MFSLESPHPGNSNQYTQYTIFDRAMTIPRRFLQNRKAKNPEIKELVKIKSLYSIQFYIVRKKKVQLNNCKLFFE